MAVRIWSTSLIVNVLAVNTIDEIFRSSWQRNYNILINMTGFIGVTRIISTVILFRSNSNVIRFNVVWKTFIGTWWPRYPLQMQNKRRQKRWNLNSNLNTDIFLPKMMHVQSMRAEKMSNTWHSLAPKHLAFQFRWVLKMVHLKSRLNPTIQMDNKMNSFPDICELLLPSIRWKNPTKRSAKPT